MPNAGWLCTTCNVNRTMNIGRVCTVCLKKPKPKPKREPKSKREREKTEEPTIRIYRCHFGGNYV